MTEPNRGVIFAVLEYVEAAHSLHRMGAITAREYREVVNLQRALLALPALPDQARAELCDVINWPIDSRRAPRRSRRPNDPKGAGK